MAKLSLSLILLVSILLVGCQLTEYDHLEAGYKSITAASEITGEMLDAERLTVTEATRIIQLLDSAKFLLDEGYAQIGLGNSASQQIKAFRFTLRKAAAIWETN